MSSAARQPTLVAPSDWQAIDFISDLHLQASEPLTFDAWKAYMARTQANAVFILGDLFEVWVGDDAAFDTGGGSGVGGGFEGQCAAVLRQTAERIPVFFMHGNRDFLVGQSLMQQCGCALLNDPTVLLFAGQRWLLSHGDALCLGDTDYLKFRAMVRSNAWQQDFMAKPLAERRAIARALREQSEARKKSAATYADVDPDAAVAELRAARATHLIHGHTHRPADHVLEKGLLRMVLSDWDLAAVPPRAEVLRLSQIASSASPTGWGVGIARLAPEHA